jgi:hypothetical protein
VTEHTWRCAIVRFGSQTERTSALAHLTTPANTTACGVVLAASKPEPNDARRIRCQRCIDARATR